ncbi:MAG: hypothetical protein KAT70_04365, partial [Thermoplasmata archaeon]|nr:hypothetical protein [Thermoplasmata archaeon]
KESSVIIIYPKEEVDLKITYDQVNLFPHMPTVGEETTVEVMFTGLGKNWASATVLILFYEGDYLIETREAVANMGENGPYDFKWTPKTPGEHRIRIVLDESDISSPGLNATNNKVEQIVTVLPEEEEAVIGTEEGPPPYLLILIVIVIMAISAIGVGYAFSSQRKSRSEEPAEENKILDVPGQPPIPVPQHGPEGTPQGFFIHSTGSPSTWIDTTSGKL